MSNIMGFGDFPAAGAGGAQGQQGQYEGFAQESVGIPINAPPEVGIVHSIKERLIPRFKFRTFTWFICVVNMVMLLVEFIVGEAMFGGAFVMGNTMAGPGSDTLIFLGAKFTPDIQAGQVYRLVTPIFLHGGLLHLLMNMIFTFQFAFTLELRWGIKRFIAVYFITGIGANLLSACTSPGSASVGASGALFGLFGANITYLLMNWIDIPGNSQEMCIMVFVIIINFVMGAAPGAGETKSTVDWAAHLGGLLTGLFLGAVLTPVLRPGLKTPLFKFIGGTLGTVYMLTTALLLFLYVEA